MPDLLRQRGGVLATSALMLFAGGAAIHLASRYHPVHVADIAAVTLVDQDEAARSLVSWHGQVVVLDFIYTGCGDTCPLKTARLAAVQAGLDPALRRRVHFVSVSVDPEHDDPAALRAYAARAGADLSGWSFLTGGLSEVARFAALFDPMAETGADAPSHITTVRLLDRDGRVMQRYIGETLDDQRLARDIVALAAAEPEEQ